MSTTAVFLIALTAAGLVLLLWVIGRAVTAAGNRIPPAQGRSRHYLAGRLDGVQITTITGYGPQLRNTASAQEITSTKSASDFTFRKERKLLTDPPAMGSGRGLIPAARRKRTGGLSITCQPVASISTALQVRSPRSR